MGLCSRCPCSASCLGRFGSRAGKGDWISPLTVLPGLFWVQNSVLQHIKGAVKQPVLTPCCIKHLLRQLKPRELRRCWGFQHKAGHGLLRGGTSPPDGTWLCQGRAETSVASSMVLVVAIPTSLSQGCSRLVPQFPYLGRGVSDSSAESFELRGLQNVGYELVPVWKIPPTSQG